ncbi:MAG TPA: phosphoribosylformylglycinamidine synthase subunit PurL [Candidatus Acidoferrales bacterium]|nr:phosphoribosylformylglycinamidine synthase subunit PurL [Candidatus Acidoferrales bacterium]
MTARASEAIAVLRVHGSSDAEIEEQARHLGIALTLSELRLIAERLGRDPTVVEAHAFDAQWSEHCSYKSSRHLLSRLPTEGPTVMLGPKEDAGIVHLGEWKGESYGIVIAHESHNHPSQVVPFEGAATGIGGIVRDVLCMGAHVIAVGDPLRFGTYRAAHPRYVAQGVVDGIAAYGNAIGVPNIAGDIYFDAGFDDNCLVNVVALGLVKEREIIHSFAPPDAAGWDIVLVGKATDRSGFGGAAFSSLVLDEEDAQQNKGAVQVPDPFLKNVLMRASYRAFEAVHAAGLTVGFKDLGAGGIMGCTAEIVASGGFGATIDLDACPTSQPNLPPAVIAVGETQERLTWVVPPSFTPALLAIYNEEFTLPQIARGACAAVIGKVEASSEYVLRHQGEEVMRVPIDFLTGGIRYERPYTPPAPRRVFAEGEATSVPADGAQTRRFDDLLERILSHHDVCSRKPVYERFDSVVRGTTSIPCGYADAGLIVPIPGAPLAAALAVDGNPRYAKLSARLAAEHAVLESVRNVVAVGTRPAGLTDCLNFGNPQNPEHLGELVVSIDGLAHAARELGVPFVSGNVSLYNVSANGNAIPPSAIVACVGTTADISKTANAAFKEAGSTLFLLGEARAHLGGSVVADILQLRKTELPAIEYARVRAEIACLLRAFDRGLVLAAHDISDGGLLAAIAEMAFASRPYGLIGAEVEDSELWAPDVVHIAAYFGEAQGFVCEVNDRAAFEALARETGAAHSVIGRTIDRPELHLKLTGDRLDLHRLHEVWSAPLRDFYEDVVA